MKHVNLPMVFGEKLDLNEIKAAGIASSYFGALAQWRGASFPVLEDQLPKMMLLFSLPMIANLIFT